MAALYRNFMDFMIHMKYREEIADNLYAFLPYHGDCVLGRTLQARNVGEFDI